MCVGKEHSSTPMETPPCRPLFPAAQCESTAPSSAALDLQSKHPHPFPHLHLSRSLIGKSLQPVCIRRETLPSAWCVRLLSVCRQQSTLISSCVIVYFVPVCQVDVPGRCRPCPGSAGRYRPFDTSIQI